jgi:nicotinamide-nucleotide amidase
MKAELITIGDEILIGQIVDSNSAYIAAELNKIGIEVYQITSVQDDEEHIRKAFDAAASKVDLIITTGGLGPTKDDITKNTWCNYFADELALNQDVLSHIEDIFHKYVDTPILPANKSQAYLPSKSIPLFNRYGTAPGMWMEGENAVFVSLPGVPFEMKSLFQEEVIPKLKERFKTPYILHKTVLTYGLGESAIADKIEKWEEDLPTFIKLAYLPSLGRVRLRLTARGVSETILLEEINKQVKDLHLYIGDIIRGYEDELSLEEQIAKLLTCNQMKLVTAESCTGGKIASRITDIPGASKYFLGSIVTYATSAKESILKVPSALIEEYSVVSKEVAEEMAKRALALFDADVSVSTTGNAGPTKGDSNAEIGSVYIAIATKDSTTSFHFNFGNHRERITQKAVNKSFELLLNHLQQTIQDPDKTTSIAK